MYNHKATWSLWVTPKPVQLQPPNAQTAAQGVQVPEYRVFRVSILGTVIMVLGRYLPFGYLDLGQPQPPALAGWKASNSASGIAQVSSQSFGRIQKLEPPFLDSKTPMVYRL